METSNKWAKAEVAIKKVWAHRWLGIQTTFQGGGLTSFKANKTMANNEHFYMGGSRALRGFKEDGVGPTEACLKMGGNAFYLATIALTSALPWMFYSESVRAQAVYSVGDVVALSRASWMDDVMRRGMGSSSVGLGLLVKFSNVKLDVSYCWPLSGRFTDLRKEGVNFRVTMAVF